MNETILIVLGGVGLLAAGAGLGYWLAQRRLDGKSARAEEIERQFDDYRRNVTEHFGRTAEHFQAIGREYRELYEHMASGAESLCEREPHDAKLSFAPQAILESIEEARREPGAPRDVARSEPDSPGASEEKAEIRTAETNRESAQAPDPEGEAEADDHVGRTLH